jgi:hypothetical protein
VITSVRFKRAQLTQAIEHAEAMGVMAMDEAMSLRALARYRARPRD